jgi:hypothetical protein
MAASAAAVELYTDPRTFLAEAGQHLAAAPVINTVVATTTERMARRLDERGDLPTLGYEPWWALVRDDEGGIAGAAMRTAPPPLAPLFVLPMPEDGVRQRARLLHTRGEAVGGVNGALPAARSIADTGYASAAVVEVSRRSRDAGIRVCLFTDQANPTSNAIYQRLGYHPIVDMADLVIR